jgi:hypothetical protein
MMLKSRFSRAMFAFLGALLISFSSLVLPQVTVAQDEGNPWQGLSGSMEERLSQIVKTPLKDFPAMAMTEEMMQQFSAIGSSLPSQFQLGEMVSPESLFAIGNFDPGGFTNLNLQQIAKLTNVDLSGLGVEQIHGLFSELTPEKLLQTAGLNLGGMKLADVPLLKELAIQKIFEQGKLGQLGQLGELSALLNGGSGSLDGIVSSIAGSLGVGDLMSVANGINLPQSLGDLGSLFGDVSVEAMSKMLPDFAKSATNAISPERLVGMSATGAIPGLDQVSLKQIPGVGNLPISGLGDLNVGSLSLSDMMPVVTVPGFRVGVADISLGTPGGGDKEQRRIRVVSGGIQDKSMIQTGAMCQGSSCPHFELAVPMDPTVHGAAWIEATGQRVPDGFGLLCQPWSCKGPPGTHPFGPMIRLLLKDVNQSQGTAQLALSFPICYTLFLGDYSCTPWVFPTPDGIPFMQVPEGSPVVFSAPGLPVVGEQQEGKAPPPSQPTPIETNDAPPPPEPPSRPVPPPPECVDQGTCPLLNSLPDQSSVGIYSRFRRRRPRHNGIDHQSKNAPQNRSKGTANAIVVAPADGVVSQICNMPCGGYGNYVEIEHPKEKVWTVHAHLYKISVSPGQEVKRGDVIGIEGGSGRSMTSYGIHEHLEVKTQPGMNRGQVDPERYRWDGPSLHSPPKPSDLFGP